MKEVGDWEYGSVGPGAFSDIDEGVDFALCSPNLDLLGGLNTFPSALCWAKTGEDAWPLLRCLFDGIPRADARLLAIEELISRGAL